MNITINEFKITTNPDPYGFGLVKDSVPDPYVFGPSGSESVIYRICTDPELDPSINKQKKKKNLDFYMNFGFQFQPLSFFTDGNPFP